MILSTAKEFEIYYPRAVKELRQNVSPLIRAALAQIEEKIGSRPGAGMILERYISAKDATDYLSRLDTEDYWIPTEYVEEYAVLARTIVGQVTEYLPDSLPEGQKAKYARILALTLSVDAICEAVPPHNHLRVQRLHPSVYWHSQQREN